MSQVFSVDFSLKGQVSRLENVTTTTSAGELVQRAKELFQCSDSDVKLLYKGKNLSNLPPDSLPFNENPSKTPKVLVMATSASTINEMQTRKSDPTMRGFENEKTPTRVVKDPYWGTDGPHRKYKFVKIEECRHFRGHDSNMVPHQFEARRMLEKLSLDPGIQVAMKERELVVNTLGEMDPVDDRLAQKKEAHGACLLGYNTNHGLRIDVRLRSSDLKSFLPYNQVAATLIHEISHNWFGEHNLYFWTNYGQMRVEYLFTHFASRSSVIWKGKTSAQIADLPSSEDSIANIVMKELVIDMAQHRLHPNMIAEPLQQRYEEVVAKCGQSLGTKTAPKSESVRDLMLDAAEKRAKRDN